MKLDITKHKDLVSLLLYVCIRLHCLMRIVIRPQAISNVVNLNKWSVICIGLCECQCMLLSSCPLPWGGGRGEGGGGVGVCIPLYGRV